MSYKVLAIANEFLERADKSSSALTGMQLQKLCYLAHGFCLALLGEALTRDPVEAWDYGPVYPTLYDALRQYGGSPVPSLICENNWAAVKSVRGEVVRAELPDDETKLIDTVWADYGNFQAFQLSALTHEDDSPWAQIYRPGIKHLVIPDSLIKEYFLGLTQEAHA